LGPRRISGTAEATDTVCGAFDAAFAKLLWPLVQIMHACALTYTLQKARNKCMLLTMMMMMIMMMRTPWRGDIRLQQAA